MHALRMWFAFVRRNRFIASINVLGLALGLAVVMLISLYVRHELRHDRHHPHLDRLYRVVGDAQIGTEGELLKLGTSSPPIAPSLEREVPGVEETLRFWTLQREEPVKLGSRTMMLENVTWADSTLFDMLHFPLAAGDPSTALVEPQSVVLSAKAANVLFGDQNPIGETITLNNEYHYEITGVLEPYRHPSSLPEFSIICSFSSLEWPDDNGSFVNNNSLLTFVRLHEGVDPAGLIPAMKQMVQNRDGEILEAIGGRYELALEPVPRMHFVTDYTFNMLRTNDPANVLMFAAIGIFTLLIACLNYVNLSIAQSIRRLKQVGIAKTVGASRAQLIRQYLLESILTALIALALGVGLMLVSLPHFSQLARQDLAHSFLSSWWDVPVMLLFTVLIGLAAGFYPAARLASARPLDMLARKAARGRQGSRLRQGLVLLQFAISITLVIATLTVHRQLNYLNDKDLGFSREGLLVIPLIDNSVRPQWETLRNEIDRISGVTGTATSGSMPLMDLSDNVIHIPGSAEESNIWMHHMYVDHEFLEMLNMKLVQGRNFRPGSSEDSVHAVLLNETAVRTLGWEEQPLGQTIEEYAAPDTEEKRELRVIGVVSDFHFASLHRQIGPIRIMLNGEDPYYIIVRLSSVNPQQAVANIEQIWNRLAPNGQFTAQYLDDVFQADYGAERRLATLFALFAGLAIFIACLGLFALAAFASQQRTKEIGIRKVLGSTTEGIVTLLVKEFLLIVGLANLFAIPVAWYLMNRWLESFAYRSDLGVLVFASSALGSLFIALLTVIGQALRAAQSNPVKALRYE